MPLAAVTTDHDDTLDELMWEGMSGPVIATMAGANVIMQLARRPIGRGVAESVVESGSLFAHPLKRSRTTLGYVAIALFGTEDERAAYKREVDEVHRLVRSEPGSEVSYNAFDRTLQLWVAACMYVGVEDAMRLHRPEVAEGSRAEAIYQRAGRFATTLQVPPDMWPADRAAFATYWADNVGEIEFDDVTRTYLYDFASLRFLPAPLSRTLGPLHRFVTTGFLPEPFRDGVGLTWNPARQRAHDRLLHAVVRVNRRLPGVVRRFPLNLYLWDTRRRIRTGRNIL